MEDEICAWALQLQARPKAEIDGEAGADDGIAVTGGRSTSSN
jgi:hypothetical protein